MVMPARLRADSRAIPSERRGTVDPLVSSVTTRRPLSNLILGNLPVWEVPSFGLVGQASFAQIREINPRKDSVSRCNLTPTRVNISTHTIQVTTKSDEG